MTRTALAYFGWRKQWGHQQYNLKANLSRFG